MAQGPKARPLLLGKRRGRCANLRLAASVARCSFPSQWHPAFLLACPCPPGPVHYIALGGSSCPPSPSPFFLFFLFNSRFTIQPPLFFPPPTPPRNCHSFGGDFSNPFCGGGHRRYVTLCVSQCGSYINCFPRYHSVTCCWHFPLNKTPWKAFHIPSVQMGPVLFNHSALMGI